MSNDRLRLKAAGLAGLDQGVEPAVLVEDGRIVAIGEKALGADAELLDLSPLWLSPAPLDAHVHLFMRGTPTEALVASRAAGVAAVRDLGNKPGKPMPTPVGGGPFLVASGPGLGHGWLGEHLEGPAAYRAAAKARLASGAKVLKIFATGLVDIKNLGQVKYPMSVSRQEMAAVVEVGRAAGVATTVHASGSETVGAAVAAGVDSIEHGFFLQEEDLREMARQGVSWSPTIAPAKAYALDAEERISPWDREQWARVVRWQEKNLLVAADLGVRLVLGSDAGSYGVPHGKAAFLEMQAWLAAGLDPGLVFRAATSLAAEAMGLKGKFGSLLPGAKAWLLGVRENPAKDPMTLSRPAWRNF